MFEKFRRSCVATVSRVLHSRVLAVALLLTFAADFVDSAAAESEQQALKTATLEIEITNLESDDGWLVIALLDSAAQFDDGDQSFRSAKEVPIREGKARIAFEGIPYGSYAVRVFHDENSNGDLDTNFVGFPKEGFGFSNDAMGSFGPPSFEQAAFEVDSEILGIKITVQ